jgi:hypothetical protein
MRQIIKLIQILLKCFEQMKIYLANDLKRAQRIEEQVRALREKSLTKLQLPIKWL